MFFSFFELIRDNERMLMGLGLEKRLEKMDLYIARSAGVVSERRVGPIVCHVYQSSSLMACADWSTRAADGSAVLFI